MGCKMGTRNKSSAKANSAICPQLCLDALPSLNRKQLQSHCKQLGLKAGGKNTELLERLQKHLEDASQNSPLDANNNAECSSKESRQNGAVPGRAKDKIPKHQSDEDAIPDEPTDRRTKKASRKAKAKNSKKAECSQDCQINVITEETTASTSDSSGALKQSSPDQSVVHSEGGKTSTPDQHEEDGTLHDQARENEGIGGKVTTKRSGRQRKGQPRKKRAVVSRKEGSGSVLCADDQVDTFSNQADKRDERKRNVYAAESERVSQEDYNIMLGENGMHVDTVTKEITPSHQADSQDKNVNNNNEDSNTDISTTGMTNVNRTFTTSTCASNNGLTKEECSSSTEVQNTCINSEQEQQSNTTFTSTPKEGDAATLNRTFELIASKDKTIAKDPASTINKTFTLSSEDSEMAWDENQEEREENQGPVSSTQPSSTSPQTRWCVVDGLVKQDNELAWKQVRLKGGRPVVPNRFGKYIAFTLTPTHLSLPEGLQDNFICGDCVKHNERTQQDNESRLAFGRHLVHEQQEKEDTPLSRESARGSIKRKRDDDVKETGESSSGAEELDMSMSRKRRRSGIMSRSGAGTPASPDVRKERGETLDLPRNHKKPWQPKKQSSIVLQEDVLFAKKVEDIIRNTVAGSEEELQLIMGTKTLTRSPPRT